MPAQARAVLNKTAGVLLATQQALLWTPDGHQRPALNIPCTKLTGLRCSKEGASKAKLKLLLSDNPDGYTFAFASPPPTAEADLATFKVAITEMISNNAAPPVAPPTPSLPAPSPFPKGSPAPSYSRAGSATPGPPPSSEFEVRKRVLTKMPALAALHRELVIGGQITESEFWEGRQNILQAETAAGQQRRGKASEIVDLRPTTTERGDLVISLTPQMVTDIFEEFPIVERAYHENVPKPLKETEFWERYLRSKLFNRHRASARTEIIKDDSIFDKYLEKEDDEIEPLKPRSDKVQLILDLAATEEDHEDTGNAKDVTMQAGKRRGVLPLIRRFNEHSEKLLDSALGPQAKRRRTEGESSNYAEEMDLEDLHDPEGTMGITLEMQDRQRYFEGRSAGSAVDSASQEQIGDLNAVVREMKGGLMDWRADLGGLRLEKKAGEEAFSKMSANVSARFDTRLRRQDIPEHLSLQMSTCQTAANEFLRQFWSAVYPSVEMQTNSVSTPAQRAAKAAKMAAYLGKTPERVMSLVQAAREEGIDAKTVESAFAPLLVSVEQALQTYRTRKMPGR
ncbi:hypothetical protein BOTBODRAFT_211251 [Botryobasidium botryosum FD-172 SS1]|uniref:BSD domain-containing protein n=1 Tax=Botryobasidium botryosum (strain FD-172 SS1) TaxID=930990 RepID=A0A067NC43_BOTB1|nr:hypothetical protein BOTBODRAFT_211251 [Botryobasidium botryosum FD-172 SS1]